MRKLKKEVSFLDAEGHRARITVEITERNGYPEFTASGSFLGHFGQCLDSIKPANDPQNELIGLWKKYHLKNVGKLHNFPGHLEGILTRIEIAEKEREAKTEGKEGDEAILAKMEEEGIAEDMLEAVKAYMEVMGTDELDNFDQSYSGEFSSDEDFARDMADNIAGLPEVMHWPYSCIDWEEAARELMMDYSEQNGHYFRNI